MSLGFVKDMLFGPSGGETTSSPLASAMEAVLDRQAANAHRLPDIGTMKERLRETREYSVGNTELVARAAKNLTENRFHVREAPDMDTAFSLILEEIGPETRVVKSKSNLTRELCLSTRLAERGVEVVETDIGDRIIQLTGEKPSHPTGPAVHLSAKEISEALTKALSRPMPSEPEALVEELTREIREAVASSRVGITGANALAASEGSVVMVHNEGNVSEVSRLPGKHIIVADSNKVYPDLEEAINMVKLQVYHATGSVLTSQVNILSGPTKTADIEKKLFHGVHGPSEIVVILVRRPPYPEPIKEASWCIGCGGCLLECPAYLARGSSFGARYRQGGIGVVQAAAAEGLDKAFDYGLYTCTGCGGCTPNCPVSIDTATLIARTRELAATSPEASGRLRPFKMAASSLVTAARARGRIKAPSLSGVKKGGLAYFPGCVATVSTPGLRSDAVKVIEALTGRVPAVIEGCCGGAWDSLGFKERALDTFNDFVRGLAKNSPSRLVVTCPHCYEVLKFSSPEALKEAGVEEVVRFTELAKEFMPEGLNTGAEEVAYHDSCIFGRKLGLFDEPREVLKMAGAEVEETKRGREHSRCCGFPSTLADSRAASIMAKEVVSEAAAAGTTKVVTSGCPGCYFAVKRAGSGVEDITGFLKRKLSDRGKS